MAEYLHKLETRIEQLDRRVNNTMREARVTEVDHEKGMVKVKALGLDSAWVPWMETAGAIKTWSPPSEGQRVVLFSPSGEPGQGFVLPGGYSSQYGKPHDQGAEYVLTIGDFRLVITGDQMAVSVGGVTHVISGDGVTTTGGRVEHDGLNIGSSHTHGGVTPGGADTDVPNA